MSSQHHSLDLHCDFNPCSHFSNQKLVSIAIATAAPIAELLTLVGVLLGVIVGAEVGIQLGAREGAWEGVLVGLCRI